MDNEGILLLQISNFAVKRSLPKALKDIFTKLDLGDDDIALNIIKYLCEVINDKKKLPWPVKDDRTLRFFVRDLHKFMADTRMECPGFTFPGVSLSSFLTNKEQRKSFIYELSTSAFELTHALPREPQGVLKKCKYSSKNKIVASAVLIIEENKEDNAKLSLLKHEEIELDERLKKAEEIMKKRISISNDIPNFIDEAHRLFNEKINELRISVAEKNDLINAYNSLEQPASDLNKLKFNESDLHGLNRSTMFKAQLRFYNNRNVAGALEKITEALEAVKVSNGPESNIIIEKEVKNLVDLKDYKEIENAVKCQLKFLKQKCFKDQEKVQEVLPHRDKFEVTYLHDASNFGLEAVTPDDTISNFTINSKDFLSDLSPTGSNDSEIYLSDCSNITFRNKSSFLRSKMSISTSSPLAVDLAKKKHRARFSERQPRFSEPLTELDDACHLSPVASSSYRNTQPEESFDILNESNESFTALRKSIFEWNSDDEFTEAAADDSIFEESIFLTKGEEESPPEENLPDIPHIEREPGSPGCPISREAAIEKFRRFREKIQLE